METDVLLSLEKAKNNGYDKYLRIPCSKDRRIEILKQIEDVYEKWEFLREQPGSLRDWVYCKIYTEEECAWYNFPSLSRFLRAQNDSTAGFEIALQEVKNGRKISHWIWYILPQLKGLGKSKMSKYYGLCSRFEAINYLRIPILRDRLILMAKAILESEYSVYEIFGNDSIKVRSSFLLFDSIELIPEIHKLLLKYKWR